MSDLPQWHEGTPPEPGIYITASTHPERKRVAQLATWDGWVWHHWSGFYDHAITHWMDADFPAPSNIVSPAISTHRKEKGSTG